MVPDTGYALRQHLAFMKWADELMLSAVAQHTPTQIATLQHIYLGELVWFERVSGKQNALIEELEPPPDIAILQGVWPKLHADWLDWAESLSDWDALVPHRNSKGDQFRMPGWQIVMHLVNHGSFHRGQVAAMLRAAGFAPPTTDLIIYYRKHGQAV
jgi:uncharacterized damage-inducible protein DinB